MRSVHAGGGGGGAGGDRRGVLVEREDDGVGVAGDEARHVHLAIVDEAEVVLKNRIRRVGQTRDGQAGDQPHLAGGGGSARRGDGAGDIGRHDDVGRGADDVEAGALGVEDGPVALEAAGKGADELRRDGAERAGGVGGVLRVVAEAVDHDAIAGGVAGAGVDEQVPEEKRVPVAAAERADVVEGGEGGELVVTAGGGDALNEERLVGRAIPGEGGDPRPGLGGAVVADADLAEVGDAVDSTALDRAAEGGDAHDLGEEKVAGLGGAMGVPAHVALVPPAIGVIGGGQAEV